MRAVPNSSPRVAEGRLRATNSPASNKRELRIYTDRELLRSNSGSVPIFITMGAEPPSTIPADTISPYQLSARRQHGLTTGKRGALYWGYGIDCQPFRTYNPIQWYSCGNISSVRLTLEQPCPKASQNVTIQLLTNRNLQLNLFASCSSDSASSERLIQKGPVEDYPEARVVVNSY